MKAKPCPKCSEHECLVVQETVWTGRQYVECCFCNHRGKSAKSRSVGSYNIVEHTVMELSNRPLTISSDGTQCRICLTIPMNRVDDVLVPIVDLLKELYPGSTEAKAEGGIDAA